MPLSRWVGLPFSAIAISIVVVIANLGNTIVAPVLPSIRDYFGSSAADTALMVSGFGFGRLAMDLPAGFLTGRISPSKMFAVGGYLATLFSWRAVFIFCALTPLVSFPLNLFITDHATAKQDSDPSETGPAHGRAVSTPRATAGLSVTRNRMGYRFPHGELGSRQPCPPPSNAG